MSPTTHDVDKAEEHYARQSHKSLTLKKVLAYLCVVIIVVTLCGSIIYMLLFMF
jgi:cell division protein FtsL